MKHGTVLVADSHSPMLEGVRSLLAERFESIVMVADEPSLLQAAEKLQPDLAVVDISFPVNGAKNALAVLRSRFPTMQLIALCIHDESVAVERVLSFGASAFVLKRCAATDLVPALDEVSAGRIYVSPAARGSLKGPHAENHGRANHRTFKEE